MVGMEAARAAWSEWENADGTKTGLLMFPDSMSEESALSEVGMAEREKEKTAERHFIADSTKVCEYQISQRGPRA